MGNQPLSPIHSADETPRRGWFALDFNVSRNKDGDYSSANVKSEKFPPALYNWILHGGPPDPNVVVADYQPGNDSWVVIYPSSPHGYGLRTEQSDAPGYAVLVSDRLAPPEQRTAPPARRERAALTPPDAAGDAEPPRDHVLASLEGAKDGQLRVAPGL
jgi:hypothetical protein